LELRVADRFAYLQFIGKHAEYGDTVLVKPGLGEHQADFTEESFSNAYVTFYPATVAVGKGLVEVVSHLPPPNFPQRLRRAGARSGRQVKTWIIESAAGEVLKRALTEEELQLPIAAIWNHEFLIQRIAEGWNPRQEGSGI